MDTVAWNIHHKVIYYVKRVTNPAEKGAVARMSAITAPTQDKLATGSMPYSKSHNDMLSVYRSRHLTVWHAKEPASGSHSGSCCRGGASYHEHTTGVPLVLSTQKRRMNAGTGLAMDAITGKCGTGSWRRLSTYAIFSQTNHCCLYAPAHFRSSFRTRYTYGPYV